MSDTAQFATYPSLRDKVVLVTGGASGIGESIVRAFSMQHARVVFLDIQREAGDSLVAALSGAGAPSVTFVTCDLTDIDALQRAVTTVIGRSGGVDVLVNNAGDDTRHEVGNVTSALWDRTMALNLKHQFFMSQAVIPAMRAARRGSIINLSSIGWVIPSTRVPVYVTAKAGIVGLTRTLAHELGADNIRVNCVMPGAVITERQKRLWLTEEYKARILAAQALKRLIVPEEVARLVLFLAADDSSAITNQSYVVDGGWI